MNDLVIPETAASTAALEVASAYLTPALLSHSHRVYLWAAALDIVGQNLDDLSPDLRADVLRQHPRLGLADEFLACFQAQADRKPTTAAAHAVQSGLATRITTNPLNAP